MKRTLILITALGLANTAFASTSSELFNYYCAKPFLDKAVSVEAGEVVTVIPKAGSMNLVVAYENDTDIELSELIANQFKVDKDCSEFLIANGHLQNASQGDVLARVYFDFDSSTLSKQSKYILDKIIRIAQHTDNDFLLEGHTDARGSENYNFTLGLKRAQAVGTLLDESEVNTLASSQGESSPVANNTTQAGQAKNRRVEIILN